MVGCHVSRLPCTHLTAQDILRRMHAARTTSLRRLQCRISYSRDPRFFRHAHSGHHNTIVRLLTLESSTDPLRCARRLRGGISCVPSLHSALPTSCPKQPRTFWRPAVRHKGTLLPLYCEPISWDNAFEIDFSSANPQVTFVGGFSTSSGNISSLRPHKPGRPTLWKKLGRKT